MASLGRPRASKIHDNFTLLDDFALSYGSRFATFIQIHHFEGSKIGVFAITGQNEFRPAQYLGRAQAKRQNTRHQKNANAHSIEAPSRRRRSAEPLPGRNPRAQGRLRAPHKFAKASHRRPIFGKSGHRAQAPRAVTLGQFEGSRRYILIRNKIVGSRW